MEIKGQLYEVVYEQAKATVTFKGELTLMGMEKYSTIVSLLERSLADVVGHAPGQLTLDLQQLVLLNSSGINAISKFIIKVRKAKHITMTIRGSNAHSWQEKSLINLKRLMPEIIVEFG